METTEAEMRKDALTVLCAQMQAHERYHTQKENMTWLATVGYLAATALLVGKDPFWKLWPIHWFGAWIVLLFLTSIAVISFVQSEFRNRNRTSAFFTSCNDVATQWLTLPPTKEDLKPVAIPELDKMLVFAAVETQFRKNLRNECSTPQKLSAALTVLWTIGAGIYVMLSYRGWCAL